MNKIILSAVTLLTIGGLASCKKAATISPEQITAKIDSTFNAKSKEMIANVTKECDANMVAAVNAKVAEIRASAAATVTTSGTLATAATKK